jgi:hypothetical protein
MVMVDDDDIKELNPDELVKKIGLGKFIFYEELPFPFRVSFLHHTLARVALFFF